jgi:hypothetical protein
MKAQIKKLLAEIETDRSKGYVISSQQHNAVTAYWIRLFGAGGCDSYPYTSLQDMISDLSDLIV